MIRPHIILVAASFAGGVLRDQPRTLGRIPIPDVRPSVIPDSVPQLAKYFVGDWHCRGGTPSGKTLESGVTFAMALDGHWLRVEHVDVPPGRYKSLAMWPADSAAHNLSTIFYDNFAGSRRFLGRWGADSIVWMRDTTEACARVESFTFRRTSASTYWYSWHVGRPGGAPTVLGDSATCTRVS